MATNLTRQGKAMTNWISVREASDRVPWSYKYLLKCIKDGKLPPGIVHRPMADGNYVIDADAFDRWVRNGCFTASPAQEPPAGGAAAS
jgi:hypothetical protein